MSEKNWYHSLMNLLLVFFLAAVAVCLLSLLGQWLVGRPVKAAPSVPDPTPTAHIEPELLPPAVEVLPTPTPTARVEPATPVPPTPAPPVIVAGAEGVNVRSGPGTDFDRVGVLDPGAEAGVIGRYVDWWQISYEDDVGWVAGWVVSAHNADDVPDVTPPPTPVPPSPTAIPTPATPPEIQETRWIDVDLTHQALTAYENGVPVRSFLVSTGLPQTPTPTGQFRIWIKLLVDDMEGADYYIEDVPYVMYFYRGYGLHGVTWHGNFGHPMSHGCVNLPTDEAEWLFNWAEVGTLVNVHD
jgi:lipoprotein-anchoring transpeptidase ErfK/SrfK